MSNINNNICVSTPYILNPNIYITHPIESLSIFTLPLLYEVNDLSMKYYCIVPHWFPTYLIISQMFTLIFYYFIRYYCELTKLYPGFTLNHDCHNFSYFKNKTLTSNSFRNYRPISHLPLLSEILERIVSQ